MVLHHTGQFIHILPSLQSHSSSSSSPFVTRVVARGWGAVGVEVKGRWEGNVSADFVSDFTTPPAWCTVETCYTERHERVSISVGCLLLRGGGGGVHKTVLREEKRKGALVRCPHFRRCPRHAGSEISPT